MFTFKVDTSMLYLCHHQIRQNYLHAKSAPIVRLELLLVLAKTFVLFIMSLVYSKCASMIITRVNYNLDIYIILLTGSIGPTSSRIECCTEFGELGLSVASNVSGLYIRVTWRATQGPDVNSSTRSGYSAMTPLYTSRNSLASTLDKRNTCALTTQ